MGKSLATVSIEGQEYSAPQMLAKRATRLDEIIPGTAGITGAQLVRIAQFELNRNEDLAECNPHSVLNAVYDAARLGLLLGHEAHLVPYKRHCQMIPDYRGYIALVYRSGLVTRIDADVVFPQDKFTVSRGTKPQIIHEPDLDIDRGDGKEMLYAYAVAELRGTSNPIFHVMNRTEMDRIRESSAMKDGIPWRMWPDRMWIKSAIKYLGDKRLPVTRIPGMADLVEMDNRVEAGRITRPLESETEEDVNRGVREKTEQQLEALRERMEPTEKAVLEEDAALAARDK